MKRIMAIDNNDLSKRLYYKSLEELHKDIKDKRFGEDIDILIAIGRKTMRARLKVKEQV